MRAHVVGPKNLREAGVPPSWDGVGVADIETRPQPVLQYQISLLWVKLFARNYCNPPETFDRLRPHFKVI